MRKPMLTSTQLVDHMLNKGIRFNIISKSDAEKHLSAHNNYFKLTSYRQNYTKYTDGENQGKYENLEFAYLRELARIDTEVRLLLLGMTLDIEHFLQVELIKAVEDNVRENKWGEDGYSIVTDYLDDIGNPDHTRQENNAKRRHENYDKIKSQNRNNPYCGGLLQKYESDMPIWAFVELISFGDLKDLIDYYSDRTRWSLGIDIRSLDRVRQLRNACAHGNAIINDLRPVKTFSNKSVAPKFITEYLKKAGISKTTREKKLSNPRINQMVHVLYIYDQVVTGENTRMNRIKELTHLMNERIPANREFFLTNPLLTSTYDFFKKIVTTLESAN